MNDFDSNFLNAERHIQDDGTKLVSSSSGTSSDDYDGHASGTSISISEIAGQRLYQNALETQKMIEEKIKERSKIPTPTLNLATRRRSSRESSPISGIAPRYIQLYESAKAKSYEDAEERALANAQYEVRDFSPSRNLGCERLYSLSSGKQQEGRERRIEIMKAKERPPLPDSHFKKIPVAEATKLYDRGMKHKISLEMKRMEAAFEMEELYVSPLIPASKKEANFHPRE